jgi:hypothetical protein
MLTPSFVIALLLMATTAGRVPLVHTILCDAWLAGDILAA